jgi:hypothetical protein
MGRKGCGKQQCNANYNQVTKGSGRKESKGHVLMAVHVRLFKERVRLVVDRFLVLERVVGCCLRKILCRQPELEIWSSGKMVAQMDY